MTVTMRCRDTCALCGCRLQGFYIASVRVNKGSLRTTSVGLGVVLPCPECGTEGLGVHGPSRWALDADSQARVDAYRARKGWAA